MSERGLATRGLSTVYEVNFISRKRCSVRRLAAGLCRWVRLINVVELVLIEEFAQNVVEQRRISMLRKFEQHISDPTCRKLNDVLTMVASD